MIYIVSRRLNSASPAVFLVNISQKHAFLEASLVAQMVKNLPTIWETWVQSLGWEDPLEEGMATPSSILAWRIPMDREPGGFQFIASQRVGHN